MMRIRRWPWVPVLLMVTPLWALEPNEILVVVNQDMVDSQRAGQFYCQSRGVPVANIFPLKLGGALRPSINRVPYDTLIAAPLRNHLLYRRRAIPIRCLLMVYGVPYRVYGRSTPPEQREELADLLARQAASSSAGDASEGTLRTLQARIDMLQGKETNASVDSELSMLLHEPYELYRWQTNDLQTRMGQPDVKTLLVARLDGPTPEIVRGLVTKALKAEAEGLRGKAYVDARGFYNTGPYGRFDQALRDFALWLELDTPLSVQLEDTPELFGPGACPDTALYCGWYRLKNYQDAFDFVDGAIGYHVASGEATDLHGPESSVWCTAMLRDGITATLGPVDEPYLHSFPQPKPFFQQLYQGRCLVEAYYLTKPFNSWQLVLIGDPLYTPFRK